MASGSLSPSSKTIIIDAGENPSDVLNIYQGEYVLENGICHLKCRIKVNNNTTIPAGTYCWTPDGVDLFPIVKSDLGVHYCMLISSYAGAIFFINPQGKLYTNSRSAEISPAAVGPTIYINGSYPYE